MGARMIGDARSLGDGAGIEADIAIIGGGAAAIAMAKVLAGSRLKVVILESGGLDLEPGAQDLHAGTQSGLPYFALDESRYRMLGGSTYRWGARSAPMTEIDMAPRPWLGLPGWPIPRAALQPFYDRIPELLNLHAPFGYDEVEWGRFGLTPPAVDPARFGFSAFQFGKTLLLGQAFREDLRRAGNVDVLLHATVTRIAASPGADHVEGLEVRTLTGKRLTVRAGAYVLATGGIENARLLLLSDDVAPRGLGNAHDHVGRYFMEHPTASAGIVHADRAQALHDVFSPGLVGGRLVETALVPTPGTMEREGMLNVYAATRLDVAADPTQAFREILWNLRHRKIPMSLSWYRRNAWLRQRLGTVLGDPFSVVGNMIRHARGRPKRFRIEAMRLELRGEQAPNPDSRVTLGEARDALGQRRAHLNWELTRTDWHTMTAMARMVDEELRRLGLGRVELAPWVVADAPQWPEDLVGGHHHMGTTRMSAAPGDGVVDADCRVHGMDNLWIAGASVFPTSGYVNPTTTVLALALRLAEHLKARAA